MNVLYWNCRGFANLDTRRTLRDLVSSRKPNIICLAEPMCLFSSARSSFFRKLGFSLVAFNNVPGKRVSTIWILVSLDIVDFNVILSHPQHVTASFKVEGVSCYSSFIYASTSSSKRRILWDSLADLNLNGAWFAIGDFNSVLGAHETTGTPRLSSCMDFAAAISLCNWVELDLQGPKYTWSGTSSFGRVVLSKLDRAFTTESFLDSWAQVSCLCLHRLHSDHHPIFLSCSNSVTTPNRPFRFREMWVHHDCFIPLVKEVWSINISGPPSFVLCQKLKNLRSRLKVWNWQVFGNLNLKIQTATDRVTRIQRSFDDGVTTDLLNEEIDASSELDNLLFQREVLLREQSRVKWLKEGDRNSAFFHSVLKRRKKATTLRFLKIGENLVDNEDEISDHILGYYKELFSEKVDYPVDYSIVEDIIPSLVTSQDNSELIRIPSFDEVQRVVFDMDASSAPGPDGFTGVFFRHCWEIVGPSVYQVVYDFFVSGKMHYSLNSNLMVLIPKMEGADKIEHFRPIAMSNFIFKVISRILAERLGFVCAKILTPNQFGFVPSRNSRDAIVAAADCFHVVRKNKFGRNMAIKVDIRKAFDTMRWDFIVAVLHCFGFSNQFVSWILSIFDSARLSIMINGTSHGFFGCSRGVRQGDPLSPLLFVIAEDFLSRFITKLCDKGEIHAISSPRACKAPTHFLFADDVLLFTKASLEDLDAISHAFKLYGFLSGQQVNWEKSFIYFGNSVSPHLSATLLRHTNMRCGGDTMTYLGVPLFGGAPRVRHLRPIMDKLISKLDSWSGMSLSYAGRLCLIKSTIMGGLNYYMQVYKWPMELLKTLTSAIYNFLWTGFVHKRKVVVVSKMISCKSLDDGGLGLRDLNLHNAALLKKLAWSMMVDESHVFSYLRARFFADRYVPKSYPIRSPIWGGLKGHVLSIMEESIWIIGRHSRLRFWHDNWMGVPLIHYVDDVLSVDPPLDSRAVDFVGHNFINLPQSFCARFPVLVEDIKQVVVRDDDYLLWRGSVLGEVSVADAYKLLQDDRVVYNWGKTLWSKYIPPSRSFLLWRLFHGKLPTEDLLSLKGLYLTNCCRFCYKGPDSIHHVFLECSLAQALWNAISSLFRRRIKLDGSVLDLWLKSCKEKFSPQLRVLWQVALASAFWALWYVRNCCIHEEGRMTIHQVLSIVWSSVREANKLGSASIANKIDELQILHSLRIVGRPSRAPRIIEVLWKFPSPGWIKVNTDGAAFGSPGLAGSAGVFRNCRGFIRGCFALPIGIAYAFEAELVAAIHAINYAWDRGWKHLWLETDSTYLVYLFKRKSKVVPWRWRPAWECALDRTLSMIFHVSHIYREGNKVADSLAARAPSISSSTWWNTPPAFVSPLVNDDIIGRPNFRFG